MIPLSTRLIRLLSLGASLLLASSLHAQTALSSWTTTGLTAGGPGDLAANATADFVTGGSLIRGAGMPYATGTNGKWTGKVTTNYSSFSAALVAANYFSFTLAPETGHTLSVGSISMGFTVGSLTTGINTGQWQYSLDGGTFVDFGSSIKPASATVTDSYLSADGGDFTVADGSSATFRFVAWAANGTTSNSKSWGLGDAPGGLALTVYGEANAATVPEPAAYAAILGGVVLLGVVFQRRRHAISSRHS